jgi:hypothetical protein
LLRIPKLTTKILNRFWSKVKIKDKNDCWQWIAYCTQEGYGQFRIGKQLYYATRVALASIDRRDNSLEVCHSCNNPMCVNPYHLRFGTHKENIGDMIIAGRKFQPLGSNHGRSKLTETDIPIIRKLAETVSCRELGTLFNVSAGLISHIITKRCWKQVDGVASDNEANQYLRCLDLTKR